MKTSLPAERRARRRRRRTASVAVLIGLAIVAGGTLLAYSWRDELPAPVASHWGADGTVNGLSTLDGVVGVMLGVGGVLVLFFGAVTLWLGQASFTRRIGAAATIWSALFLSILTVGTLAVQRGLSDARDVGGIGGVLALAIVSSVAAAVVVGIVVPGDPREPTRQPIDARAPRATVSAEEHAVWIGRVESRAAVLVGLAAAGLVVALMVWTGLWALLLVAVLLFALVATMSVAVVRVDSTGVTVRSPLGVPRMMVPLDEVVRADVRDVLPFREFGGWGWRVGRGGRVGVVLRAGESLLLERTGGRSVVVTVDGAAAAAGLINSLADRDRTDQP